MTKTSIDEMMQLLRVLKTSQVRKQLEKDLKDTTHRYWDDKHVDWISRTQVIQDFLIDAKEQI